MDKQIIGDQDPEHFHQDLLDDHDHKGDLTVRRVTGFGHNHYNPDAARTRRADSIASASDQELTIVHAFNVDKQPAAVLAGTAAVVRTVNVWGPDGSLIYPCAFGYHAAIKYNVVQMHHKFPIGLGGPIVELEPEDCGWEFNLPGLLACGLHHDDVHLLWRMMDKALKPTDAFMLLKGWRGKFGKHTVEAVEQGWAKRVLAIGEG